MNSRVLAHTALKLLFKHVKEKPAEDKEKATLNLKFAKTLISTIQRSQLTPELPICHDVLDENPELKTAYEAKNPERAALELNLIHDEAYSQRNISIPTRPNLLDQIDSEGRTVLVWAAKNNHHDLIPPLVNAGANPNLNSSTAGSTALIWCAHNGAIESVRFLLSLPGIEINKPDAITHVTALQMASKNGHFEVAKMLVHARAKVFTGPGDALIWALQEKHLNIFNLLLTQSVFNDNYFTAYHRLIHFKLMHDQDHDDSLVISLKAFRDKLLQQPNLQISYLENLKAYIEKLQKLTALYRRKAITEMDKGTKLPTDLLNLISQYDSPLEKARLGNKKPKIGFFQPQVMDSLLEDKKEESRWRCVIL